MNAGKKQQQHSNPTQQTRSSCEPCGQNQPDHEDARSGNHNRPQNRCAHFQQALPLMLHVDIHLFCSLKGLPKLKNK